MKTFNHISAMPEEVLHYLAPEPGKTYVDGTLGGAGHSLAILERIMPGGTLIAIDQDIDAINNAKTKLSEYKNNLHLIHRNFDELPEILEELNITGVDGILIDIGLSQHQLENSGRGFSFQKDEPLDMRMDIRADKTAEHFVNTLDEKNLADIFFRFGEEKFSRQVARKIIQTRNRRPISTSRQLADIVTEAIPAKAAAKQKIHPATRVFQALRIAVNKELERLQTFLNSFSDLLNPEGRLCVLSFHSLEDRLVKRKIKELETECVCPPDFPICVCKTVKQVKALSRKVVRPGEEEVSANPMARSTKLRACEKL